MKHWPYQLEDFETEQTINGVSVIKKLDLTQLAEAVIELSEKVNVLEQENKELKDKLEMHKKDIFVHNGPSLFGR